MNKLVTELFDAYLTKNPGATTSSKFGKNNALDPFVRTINGIKILTVYKAEHEFVKFAKENARNAEGYHEFVSRTAIYLNRVIRQNNIHTVISAGSSSPLIDDIVHQASKMSNVSFLFGCVKKNPVSSIRFEPSNNVNAETIRKQEDNLKRAKEQGKFSIKSIMPQFRPMYKGILRLDGITEKDIINKNVLVVDDMLTSGTTITNIVHAITDSQLVPKSVIAWTIFKK